MFISVDLPEPDWPTMATISPAWISRFTSRSTAMTSSPAGNSRRRSRRRSSGAVMLIGAPCPGHRPASACRHGCRRRRRRPRWLRPPPRARLPSARTGFRRMRRC
ncbi:hypothetical protein G6F56_014435 [Rhizopus delemar]|nr:hypothetical protein G6F56_014435 [Rhizopus delemar]